MDIRDTDYNVSDLYNSSKWREANWCVRNRYSGLAYLYDAEDDAIVYAYPSRGGGMLRTTSKLPADWRLTRWQKIGLALSLPDAVRAAIAAKPERADAPLWQKRLADAEAGARRAEADAKRLADEENRRRYSSASSSSSDPMNNLMNDILRRNGVPAFDVNAALAVAELLDVPQNRQYRFTAYLPAVVVNALVDAFVVALQRECEQKGL